MKSPILQIIPSKLYSMRNSTRSLVSLLFFLISISTFSQTTFTYSGASPVTVDGGTGTITIDVPTSSFGFGAVLTDINITIQYDKTDGSCATPGVGNSFHDEHGFELESPTGGIVSIFSTGTFNGADDISPGVTQIFDDEASTSIPGGIPASGTYLPEGSLASFDGINPEGTWTLRANETAGGDPLCIIGASIEITVTIPTEQPGDASGISLWLKADQGVSTSGTSVSAWTDASANGNTGTQGTGANQPTLAANSLNGHNALSFDGGDFLDFGDILDFTPGTDAFSFFTVYNVNNGNTGSILARGGGTQGNRQYQYGITGNIFFQVIGGTRNDGAGTATGQWNVSSSITSTTDVNAWLSGATDLTGAGIGTSTETQNVIVGARTGGTGFLLNGDVAEILFFDNALSTSARRDVETYLAIKYGLTLDITSQAYTVGGSSIFNLSGYANDIAGIGQDDSQGLNQTSSVSTSGDVVSMSGASNLADGEFLIWGHDGGSTATTASNLPAGTLSRLTRIWSVEETGDVGTVDISFNLTTLGLTLSGQDFALITAASGSTMPTDLATGTVNSISAVSQDATGDDIVTFQGVSLSDGDFFTLATQSETAPGNLTADLVLWLDADKGITSSSSSVSVWGDQSSSGFHASQGTSASQPIIKSNVVNSHASIELDGTDDFLSLGDVMDFVGQTDPVSFFVVFNTLDEGTLLSRALSGTGNQRQYQWYTGGNVFNQWFGGQLNGGTTNVIDAEWHIASSVVSTANADLYVDGNQEVNNGAINNNSETTNVLIGARTNGTGFLYAGDIAEIIMFDTDLTAAQHRDIETYLALKYGLTLDISTLNYTVSGSSVYNHTTYSNDIAGIIQDDSQNLSQTSSQSTTGSIIEVSNASGLGDGESFIWGHNGGLTTTTTSDVPGGVTNRLQRIWRLDETGDVGTVDISFNLTAMGIDASTSTLNLLIAASGATMPTGLSSATVNSSGSTATVNGNEILTFTGVDFADGEYFTLGGDLNQPSPGGISANLTLWLKADKGVVIEGGNVKEWVDNGGNVANNAIQTTSSAQPSLLADALNGNPAVVFDGTSTMEANGGFHSHESFLVIDPNEIYNSTNAVGRIIGFEQGDFTSIALGPTTVLQDNEIITYALDGGGYRAMQVSTTSNFGDPSIINPRHNVGATGEDIYRNGTQIIDTELNTGGFNIRSDQAFQLGESFNAAVSAGFNGSISEVISYSSRLSDADRRDVATYLAIKYGLTLDISSQAYTVGGSSIYNYTAYANDIAGIGMNDITQKLNQTASMSVNDGAMVEVSSATDLANGEYFVWGNDGGGNGFVTSDVPPGTTERLTKIWRIDETGDVGEVTISFDLSSLGIDVNNSTLNLIQAANTATIPADLATSTLITGGTVSNVGGKDILTFTGIDFADGEYFTLAGDINTVAPGGVSSGLTVWLRGDDGVASSGGLVSNWADKSGNANDAFQGNASSQPTLNSNGLNYHNTINFSNDNLDGVAGFNTHDYFVVAKPDVTVNSLANHGYVVSYTSTQGNGLALGTITLNLTNEVATHIVTGTGTQYAGGYQDAAASYATGTIFNSRNNAGATGQDLFINGGSVTITEDSPGDFANYTNQGYRLGYGPNKTNDFDGDIAEVISFNTRLSDADRRDVATYLAIQYGITLDITSQAYTEGGVTIYNETTYATDIAGIGQNLNNGLQQTTSGSINTGAIVSMTNPSDLGNGEYIIWGNDGTDKTAVQTTELPGAFDERLTTEWISVVTGSPGTTDIRIYVGGISNYGTRGQTAGLYTLLLNSSSNFSTITSSVVASSISGDTLTFQGVSLSGTTYFTLSVPPVVSSGTGNTLWLRADAGVTVSGSEVTGWSDQSGNGNDANPVTTGPTRVVSQFNSNPALDFTAESLTGAAGFNTQEYFIVLDPDNSLTSASNDEMPIGFDTGSSAGLALGAHDGTLTNEVITHSTSGGYASGYEDAGATYNDLIVINARNNAGTTAQELYVNGTNLTVNTNGTFANFSGNYSIGDNINRDDAFNGKISEVLSFSARQAAATRRDIESYLAIKYGITLDIASENYTTGGSSIYALSAYSNDIAGIGSDSGFGLSQTSSVSNNADAIVTVNGASAQSDGDFVIWGNDNGATTTTTSGLPTGTGITDRLTRVWGVTETGDPGTVTVAFNLTGLGFGASSIDDFTLIVDTNNDFTDGILATYGAASFASEVVTFTGIDFTTATNFGLGTAVNLTLDTDTDGIPDYFETAYGTDPADGDSPVAGGSPNTDASTANGVLGDGISDALESILVTNGATGPITIFTDTDGDGIPDHIEVDNGTNPFSANAPTASGNVDTDSDGIPDALEILIASEGGAANPALDTDTDSDGIPDYYEVMNGTNPNDVNDPTASGGTDTDADGISNALEAQLIAGSATGPIEVTTDTDSDGIPDYIEAQTFSDPFNSASPGAAGTPNVRTLLADYVQSSGCTSISGYQWIDITDNLGNLVFSINPVGNDLGSTCWGVRILNGAASVRDDAEDWVLNRNWYITPTTQPSSVVYVRFYSLTSENTDLHTELGNDGQSPGSLANFNADSIKITKASGFDNLDPFATGGTRTIHDPVVADYAANGKSFTIGISSFSSFTPHFNPLDPAEPLPVELINFYAEVEDDAVKLIWSTASELNNDHFVVERSIDGELFEPLGKVEGAGTVNELRNYSFSDSKPINGISYYRLKQVDYDGTTAFSSIVQVDQYFGLDGVNVLMYPNPADDYVNIKIDATVENLTLKIVDQLGRDVTGEIRKNGNLRQIDTRHLQTGIYIVKVNLVTEVKEYRLFVR